jgi:hypothetical protein
MIFFRRALELITLSVNLEVKLFHSLIFNNTLIVNWVFTHGQLGGGSNQFGRERVGFAYFSDLIFRGHRRIDKHGVQTSIPEQSLAQLFLRVDVQGLVPCETDVVLLSLQLILSGPIELRGQSI